MYPKEQKAGSPRDLYTQTLQKYHLSAYPSFILWKVTRCQSYPPASLWLLETASQISWWLHRLLPVLRLKGGITPLPVTHSGSDHAISQGQQAVQPIQYRSLIERPNSDFFHWPRNAFRAIFIAQDSGHNCTLTMMCLQCPLTWTGPQSSPFLTMTFSRIHTSCSVECLIVSLLWGSHQAFLAGTWKKWCCITTRRTSCWLVFFLCNQ